MTTKELLEKNYGSEVDLVIVECNKYHCGRRFEFKRQNWNWRSIPEDILNREVTHISLYDYKFIINVDLENNNTLALEEQIYRKKEKEYAMQDAYNHVVELYGEETANSMEEVDFEIIAERFLNKKDCDIAENAQYEYIVTEYVKEREVK